MAAKAISIAIVFMSLCIFVFGIESLNKQRYQQLFATEGTPMSVDEIKKTIAGVDGSFQYNSRFGSGIISNDQFAKLGPFIGEKSDSNTCDDLNNWANSAYKSYINLKLLVDIKIHKASLMCRHQLKMFLAEMAPLVDSSNLWNMFKQYVIKELRADSSRENISSSYRKAFDAILEHQHQSTDHELDISFVEFYGASSEPRDKLRYEMFGSFNESNCELVDNIDLIVANDPKNYIGANQAQRDVLNRLLAYCALRDYSDSSE